jgi:hypothetical protein
VNGVSACEKVIPPVDTVATKISPFACEDRGPGWFLDLGLGECWSCNGWFRNLNPVYSSEACTGPAVSFGDVVVDPSWLRRDPDRVYSRGQRVSVSFFGGHPKNAFGLLDTTFHTYDNRISNVLPTFLEVQQALRDL